MCNWSSNQEDTSDQGKRVELVTNGAYYGKIEEGNSRAINVVIWNNQRIKGFIKRKLG